MGKIVKYCASCEESFSEKFSFCPNCASAMTAYEMNPLVTETKATEFVKIFEPADDVTAEVFEEKTVPLETFSFGPPIEPETPTFLSQSADDILELNQEIVDQPKIDEPIFVAPAVTLESVAPMSFEDYQPTYQSSVAPTSFEDYQQAYPPQEYSNASSSAKTESYSSYEPTPNYHKVDHEGFYHVTFVQEKNSKVRNFLLLSATFLMMSIAFGSILYSLFNNEAYVAALDDRFNDVVYVEEPTATEPDPPEPKNKDEKDGGGGGGGNKAETPTSKGRLADQEKEPQIPPSVTMDQVTNPELVLKPATKGDKKQPPSTEKYGDPNSAFNVSSDGTGSGGGQGAGSGRGQGNGRGDGQGNGIGSGSGNGNGDGDGDGSGKGGGDNDPPAIKVGPTVPISITSKPRPNYTDAARTNQVQGTVTLRVTFLPSGQIGSISPVNGLPFGLTEQAIAAARNIRFEPAKKNGVPYAVTKQVQYNFTLY